MHTFVCQKQSSVSPSKSFVGSQPPQLRRSPTTAYNSDDSNSAAAPPPATRRPLNEQHACDASAATTDDVAPETADTLKERGNVAIRRMDWPEALRLYTAAIRCSPQPDAILHSNRSVAFLRLGQLWYANEDAERAIQLRPDWPKAHYRRAEVQKAGGQFDSALLSYARALQLQPTDESIVEAAKRVAALSSEEAMCECISARVCVIAV